jgi:putative DNA methylase
MAVVCTRAGHSGKIYISADDLHPSLLPDDNAIRTRIGKICAETGLTVPDEELVGKAADQLPSFGMPSFGDLFTPRQMLAMLTFVKVIRYLYDEICKQGFAQEMAKSVVTNIALVLDKLSDLNNSLTRWKTDAELPVGMFGRQAIPMVWDFAEASPISGFGSSWQSQLKRTIEGFGTILNSGQPASVTRGSAMQLPFDRNYFDAIVTDPPYYDNIIYADLSDFFYVWLKRAVGYLHQEHLSTKSTPKTQEAIAHPSRHEGNKQQAKTFYEQAMAQTFNQAIEVLKVGAPLVIVYAHKTTAGWATLVDALRHAGFIVVEAWPLETEMQARSVAMNSAALASSIFLVARRREGNETGSYEKDVQPELQAIVKERVETLWSKGVTGADLVIACVGAGLRAFTRFARVEYANGEEVPADKFLAEVEGAVLETLLEKLFGLPRSGVSAVDAPTRFYVLWRYAYRNAAIDAGEAIVFALPQGVELDGPRGLSHGARALVAKSKTTYRLRDFTERGNDDKLGLPPDVEREGVEHGVHALRSTSTHSTLNAPLIDVLHRVLWLMENQPARLADFLGKARPNLDHLRVVAETLAGAKLAGNGKAGGRSLVAARGAEAEALKKLTTNWRMVIEANVKPLV